ncbi:MAG: hypothetical protein KDD34_04265 [Bdellovibrionales bacterium]|nr:hypothetical protein [Bdellovibrionales bacterium]
MNTTKRLLTLAAAFMAFGLISNAYAADEDAASESKMKIEDATKGTVKRDPSAEKVDEVITNRKLRAETGSKSKYSVNASLEYKGSTIDKPLAATRPNITRGANVPATAALSGSVSGKMRIGSLDYMKAGVGLRADQPLQQTQDGKKDLYDPYLSYGRLYNVMGLQNSFDSSLTAFTKESSRKLGYMADFSISNTTIKEIGTSGLSVGIYLLAGHSFFDAEDKRYIVNGKDLGRVADYQADYYLGAYPFAEYVINDTFNLRTISGVWVYEHARGADGYTFAKNTIYQSFGLGISVTRDIYLYPNIQIIPEDIRADRTNVALSANLNAF